MLESAPPVDTPPRPGPAARRTGLRWVAILSARALFHSQQMTGCLVVPCLSAFFLPLSSPSLSLPLPHSSERRRSHQRLWINPVGVCCGVSSKQRRSLLEDCLSRAEVHNNTRPLTAAQSGGSLVLFISLGIRKKTNEKLKRPKKIHFPLVFMWAWLSHQQLSCRQIEAVAAKPRRFKISLGQLETRQILSVYQRIPALVPLKWF